MSGGRNGYGEETEGRTSTLEERIHKGVWRTYRDAEGLALLRPRVYLSVDQVSNIP